MGGEEAERGRGKERRYPLRAVYKDAVQTRIPAAAGEVDMFISLRNLLGLRCARGGKRRDGRKTKRNGPKEKKRPARRREDPGAEFRIVPGARNACSEGESLAVVGTSFGGMFVRFARGLVSHARERMR